MMLNSIRQHTQDADERQLLADAMDKLEESLSKQRHRLENVHNRTVYINSVVKVPLVARECYLHFMAQDVPPSKIS